MLSSNRFHTPSLLGGLGGPQRAAPVVRLTAERPFVLTRQQRAPQQLSLFGPPGITR